MIKKEIGIIGGAGFLGTRLISRFEKKNIDFRSYDIDISNELHESIFCDVEDPHSLEKLEKADTVFNLAAIHRDDVLPLSRYDDVNVQGAVNLCTAARKHGIKKLFSQAL